MSPSLSQFSNQHLAWWRKVQKQKNLFHFVDKVQDRLKILGVRDLSWHSGQFLSWLSNSLPPQSGPPLLGRGESQILPLFWDPPHSPRHLLQAVHWPQLPATLILEYVQLIKKPLGTLPYLVESLQISVLPPSQCRPPPSASPRCGLWGLEGWSCPQTVWNSPPHLL